MERGNANSGIVGVELQVQSYGLCHIVAEHPGVFGAPDPGSRPFVSSGKNPV
jgi:hypothetical protein